MQDTFYVDLETLKGLLKRGDCLVPNRLDGCVPEIGISAEDLAALLACDLSRVESIVAPSELRVAGFATE